MLHRGLLEGKNAIITGAAGGIGMATMKVFAENGANVWACARRKSDDFEKDCALVASDNNVNIFHVYFDITDEAAMKTAFIGIRKACGHIDILVNNAGATYDALLPMISESNAKDLFDINFFAQVRFTQYVSRIMMRQKCGAIVNIGSYLGFDGNRGQTVYSASKASIHGMTKCLANELISYGIRVNAVAPGVVDTKLLATMSKEEYQHAIEKNGMHRAANPKEIANMIMVLASDLSSYVNGQIIRVDGGM